MCQGSSQEVVRDNATGVEFPKEQSFWFGGKFSCLGVGTREKRIAFIGVKVYSIALYVEHGDAADALSGLTSDEDIVSQLVDGKFGKMLQIQMVRHVDGKTFFDALNGALEPRLKQTGHEGDLKPFEEFFQGKSITKDSNILLGWRPKGGLEVAMMPAPSNDYTKEDPGLVINSDALCHALYDVYLGDNPTIPNARKEWIMGARKLAETVSKTAGTDKED